MALGDHMEGCDRLRAAQLKAVLDHAPDAFVSMGADGRIIEWNLEAHRLFGWSRAQALGRTVAELIVPPGDRESHERGMARYLRTGTARVLNRPLEVEARCRDGRTLPVELTIAAVGSGDATTFNAFLRDVSQRRTNELALRDAEERFRRSFDEAPIGMALVSLEGRWMKANISLCEIVGYSQAELMELRFQDITHPDDLDTDEELIRQMVAGERSTYELEKRYLHAEGQVVCVQLNVSLVRDAAGVPMYFISQIQDITERKQFAERLQQMARRDHLTGLYNRRGFEEELQRQLSRTRRSGRGGAVLMLDLDGFKAINDTFGHKAGDEMLRGIAGVLEDRLRKTDIVGRLGGDEFAAVLLDVSREQAQIVSDALAEAIMSHSQLLAGQRVRMTASIGCILFDGAQGVEDLLAAADDAMYHGKRRARV